MPVIPLPLMYLTMGFMIGGILVGWVFLRHIKHFYSAPVSASYDAADDTTHSQTELIDELEQSLRQHKNDLGALELFLGHLGFDPVKVAKAMMQNDGTQTHSDRALLALSVQRDFSFASIPPLFVAESNRWLDSLQSADALSYKERKRSAYAAAQTLWET